MQLDNKLSLDEAQAGRDHRVRSTATTEQNVETSPGTPTERTAAGGPTPNSRAQQERLGEEEQKERDDARAEDQRRKAEVELGRQMRLPADTRLAIDVDVEKEEVRFQIRERRTGKLVREVPPEEHRQLMDRLKEFHGSLVDRSL